jgi:putative SOS response-associated peptidase YedK
MCGRFTLRTPLHNVLLQLGLEFAPEYPPRFNIAPSQPVVSARNGTSGREIALMRWGFMPAVWGADPSKTIINVRSETAAGKRAFRNAYAHRRCLLPADGFYEWKQSGRKKAPYLIELMDQRLFVFAGIWETWNGSDTCAILTTTANSLLAPLHGRMPVILDADNYAQWLDPTATPDRLQCLLLPYPSEKMICHPVSTRVNSGSIDDPSCVEPATPENLLF